jgi:hypothetical protein
MVSRTWLSSRIFSSGSQVGIWAKNMKANRLAACAARSRLALVSTPASSQRLDVRWMIIGIVTETFVDMVVEILRSFFPYQKLKE